ncbi:MAG: hypothetical protein HN352_14090 [Bacteroidetes bacterium]|nr:hypothetical protein [Bacteroidota bacterium]MBT3747759.1 hypothetical protein [Bacteroidota bacterium]MBT4401190.1 hypothetical protein [Bacteroidota bacterium]MBT4411129.1 hypothetical protein [Bacteroidota bacterium]MBT7464394.1 hypothetical protein [Bacteroidota bacterium]
MNAKTVGLIIILFWLWGGSFSLQAQSNTVHQVNSSDFQRFVSDNEGVLLDVRTSFICLRSILMPPAV